MNGSKAHEKTIISNSNSSDNLGEKINYFSEGMSDNFQDNIKSRSLNTPNAMGSPKSVNGTFNMRAALKMFKIPETFIQIDIYFTTLSVKTSVNWFLSQQ